MLESRVLVPTSVFSPIPHMSKSPGEKGSVPLNFLHILVGRDAFTSVTERSDRVTGGISAVEVSKP